MRFGEAVVDVRTEGVQRHAAFAVPLGAGDVGAVQTAGRHDLDAEGAQTHGVLHRALHGAAEHDALFELLRDAVGDQLSVELGAADFFDVDVNGHAHHLLNFSLERFDVGTLLADHDARTGREDRDAGVVRRTFDEDAADAGVAELLQKEAAHGEVFTERAGEFTANRVPARRPVARHGKTEAGGINFLTHGTPLLGFRFANRNIDVARLLVDAGAAALGAGGETTQRGSLLHVNLRHDEGVDVGTVVVFGVGDGALERLLDDDRSTLLREGEDGESLVHGLAANEVSNQTALLSREADTTDDSSSFHLLTHLLVTGRVALERASVRKFAELVADHVFIDVHRHVLTAVVNGDGQTDEFGKNRRTARPGLERTLVAARLGGFNLLHQVPVNKRAFLQRTRHS